MLRKYTLKDLELVSSYIEKYYTNNEISKILNTNEKDLNNGIECLNVNIKGNINMSKLYIIVPIIYSITILSGLCVYVSILYNNL